MFLSGTREEIRAAIEMIGAPVMLVDVNLGGRFTGFELNTLAKQYTEIPREIFIDRDLEDLTGLSDVHSFRFQRAVSIFSECVELGLQKTTEFETVLENGDSRWGRHTVVPILGESGEVRRLMITSMDITELKETQKRLESALTRVLSGFVTICSTCKDIKEDSGQWVPVEHYLSSDANDVQFSHGYCPKCYESAIQELK